MKEVKTDSIQLSCNIGTTVGFPRCIFLFFFLPFLNPLLTYYFLNLNEIKFRALRIVSLDTA